PVCPTFQDWARREAAHSRAEGPRASDAAAAGSASAQAQRNPPRNWSAPPPWAGGAAGAVAAAGGAAWADEGEEDLPPGGRGLSGSYADRVASGTESGGAPMAPGPDEEPDDEEGVVDAGHTAAAGAGTAAAAAAAGAAGAAAAGPGAP